MTNGQRVSRRSDLKIVANDNATPYVEGQEVVNGDFAP
jgi:hypothetical protein